MSACSTFANSDCESAQGRASRRVLAVRTTTDILLAFIYLQVLDLLTTLLGFRVGAAEASPFVRILAHAGPFTGVAIAKTIALAIGGICVWTNRPGPIRWMTYVSAIVVAWNLMIILAVTR
jgi:hypothetical protein